MKPETDRILRTQRILHAALMSAAVIYIGIGWLVTNSLAPRPAPLEFLVAMGGAAFASLGAIVVLRKQLMPPRRKRVVERIAGIEPNIASGNSAARMAVARLQMAHIVSWALAESIAVYGLVLTLLYSDPKWVVPFAAVSIATMGLLRPTESQIIETIAAATQPAA